MKFNALYNLLSSRLKITASRLAKSHNSKNMSIDADDLYQEMSVHLWNNFKDGLPAGINAAYVIKGCQFHVLNYLRKKRFKVKILSLDDLRDEAGHSLKDVLSNPDQSVRRRIDNQLTIDYIRNNGFSPREKEVFSLLLEGNTVREVGVKLGISHVMVVKYKKRLVSKWQKKEQRSVRKERFFT